MKKTRVRIKEAIAIYNAMFQVGKDVKMTKRRLATLIQHSTMVDKTLTEYLSHWDNGNFECGLDALIQISDILHVDINFLLGVRPYDKKDMSAHLTADGTIYVVVDNDGLYIVRDLGKEEFKIFVADQENTGLEPILLGNDKELLYFSLFNRRKWKKVG